MRHTYPFIRDLAYYQDRAQGLASAVASGVPEAIIQFRTWHPDPNSDVDAISARLVYARQHGFQSWSAFAEHIDALSSGGASNPFLEAFETLRERRFDRFLALLRENPSLARARGTNGNTLLNLAVSLAGSVCGPLPEEAVKVFEFLLQAGADAGEANDRGWTPLHQAAYANRPAIAGRLLDAGAAWDAEAHGEGGTPLAVALFWGHREAADRIATAGIAPRNLRIAAGLGRTDLVDACFDASGALTAEARAGRGFYRPHSGFPIWEPSDERQEILAEALVWASKADRVSVLPSLRERGADLDADPYRGTALIWAAFNGRVEAVRWLLDQGADVSRAATFGGPSHGERVTALHLAAAGDHVEVVRLLLERGADAAARDALYDATPSGWADHAGASAALALL